MLNTKEWIPSGEVSGHKGRDFRAGYSGLMCSLILWNQAFTLTPKSGQDDGEGVRLLGEGGEWGKAKEARCVKVQRDKGSGAINRNHGPAQQLTSAPAHLRPGSLHRPHDLAMNEHKVEAPLIFLQ